MVVRDSWLWTMGRTGDLENVDDHAHGEGEIHDDRKWATVPSANLSTSSDIGAPVPAPATAASGTPLPASRMLKPTPTHVDDNEHREGTPLTPSKPETQRLLNRATASPGRSASVPSRSPRGTPDSKHDSKHELKPAATMPVTGGGQNDMTAALRRLAERDARAPSRSKLVS